MTINGASTTIAGEAKPEPVYIYNDNSQWVCTVTTLLPGSVNVVCHCAYEGNSVATFTDASLTTITGNDGYVYLRGELKSEADVAGSNIKRYSIARQI